MQWIIEGAREYIQNDYKLNIPDCISKATEQYRQDNDWLTDFFDEYIVLDKNEDTYGNEIYEAYMSFCHEHGERALPMSSVIPMVAAKAGITKKRSKKGNYYPGMYTALLFRRIQSDEFQPVCNRAT